MVKYTPTSTNIGAATGRFSSSDPNLQQIPSRGEGKELRRLFGASPRLYINVIGLLTTGTKDIS